MILVRGREELKRHLEQRIETLNAQITAQCRDDIPSTVSFVSHGIMKGLEEALSCVESWEQYETISGENNAI